MANLKFDLTLKRNWQAVH